MGGKRRRLDSRGSSLVYVILFITLLGVFSSGYMAVSRHNLNTTLGNRRYMEARLAAGTIHQSFCEAVGSGDSEAMNLIWQRFNEDCDRVSEAYDEMTAERDVEEGAGDLEPGSGGDVGSAGDLEPGSGGDAGSAGDAGNEGEPGTGGDAQDGEEARWERYLRHALGDKTYTVSGTGGQPEDNLTADITVTARPLEARALVHSRITCDGFTFSLKADIVFDNSDGAVMTVYGPDGKAAGDGMKIYLSGNGVYRYYED